MYKYSPLVPLILGYSAANLLTDIPKVDYEKYPISGGPGIDGLLKQILKPSAPPQPPEWIQKLDRFVGISPRASRAASKASEDTRSSTATSDFVSPTASSDRR